MSECFKYFNQILSCHPCSVTESPNSNMTQPHLPYGTCRMQPHLPYNTDRMQPHSSYNEDRMRPPSPFANGKILLHLPQTSNVMQPPLPNIVQPVGYGQLQSPSSLIQSNHSFYEIPARFRKPASSSLQHTVTNNVLCTEASEKPLSDLFQYAAWSKGHLEFIEDSNGSTKNNVM